jgi:Mg/Co/Ni transporter MgtE
MTTPDNTSPDPGSASLPAAPWILLDRTTATQTATVLDRLEQWLAGGGAPEAVAS